MLKKKYYYSTACRFFVKDLQTFLKLSLDPTTDYITINGVSCPYTQDTNLIVYMKVPLTGTFDIEVHKDGYNVNTPTSYSKSTLMDNSIFILKRLTTDQFSVQVSWNPESGVSQVDIDSHLLIYLTTSPSTIDAHLFYNAGRDSTYPDYFVDEQRITCPRSVIKHDNKYYILDYDDTSGLKEHNENVSGKVVTGRIYKFVVFDFNQLLHISSFNTEVKLTFGNISKTFTAPAGSYNYWTVFLLIEDNGDWIIDESVEAHDNNSPW